MDTDGAGAAGGAGGSGSAGAGAAAAPNDVCIVGYARTPIGSFGGALSSLTAMDLGAHVIKAALERAGVKGDAVDEVIMGNVLQAGLGQNPARQAALKAGLPDSVPCTTVNKVCASGMKSVSNGAMALMLGLRRVVVAGGMESMSRAPYAVEKMRFGAKMGHASMTDTMLSDGLWDAANDQHMGCCAELCASKHGVSREEQDAFAAESYRRAIEAAKRDGGLAKEIVPIEVPGPRRGAPPVLVTGDEEPAKNAASAGDGTPGSVPAALAKLRPAFKHPGGEAPTVTAGNASTLSDGAAAVVLVRRDFAASAGLRVLAVVRGFDDAATKPEEFTTAPSLAVPRAMRMAGVGSVDDVDLWELNEAFAVVGVANSRLLGLDPAKVNVFGGAVALGHPLGCSGARIIVTLCNALAVGGKRLGVAGICNGGGGASAIVIEHCG